MNAYHIASRLEASDDLHLARLLILLKVFAGKQGQNPMAGLTKLAKLDFLLRYPVYLERALVAKHEAPAKAQVAEHERKSVESRMVRYKFGPWDFRYRRFLNILVAKGLAEVHATGRTINIKLTPLGIARAEQLVTDENFDDLAQRAQVLKQNFDIAPTNLMRFIYDTFPEIATLRFGEPIDL